MPLTYRWNNKQGMGLEMISMENIVLSEAEEESIASITYYFQNGTTRYLNPEGLLDYGFLFDQEIEPLIEDFYMEVSDAITSFKSENPDAVISYHWHSNYENRTTVRLQIGCNQYLYMSVCIPDNEYRNNLRATVYMASRSIRVKTKGHVKCQTPLDAAEVIINEVKRICKLSPRAKC